MFIIDIAKKNCNFILFFNLYVRLYKAKLFNPTDKRPLTPNKILRIAKKIKIFLE